MSERERETVEDPFRYLIEESRAGRTIVPFLGAGISAEVGFPPLSLLTEYLATVQGFLHRRLFRPADWKALEPFAMKFESGRLGRLRDEGLEPVDSLLNHGSLRDYLYRVGWPDPNRLHADIWHYLSYSTESEEVSFPRLKESVVLREVLRGIRNRDDHLARVFWASVGSESDEAWRPTGTYWRELLESLTRSDRDLVDSLFQVLTDRRQPGLSHRYLALLVPILRLRLFFTINFDPFLEQALLSEGHAPEVFSVSEREPLPHPSLIRDKLSVVKLHGSGHSLRVGESLNAPVDRETKSRFRGYLADDPILLVLGVGGWDERILDLMETVFDDRIGQEARTRSGEVVWLHFEPDGPPQPVGARFGGIKGRLHPFRVRHPGAFLEELYVRLTGGHPATRSGHRPYPPRPIPLSVRTSAATRLWPDPPATKPRAEVTAKRWPPPVRVFMGHGEERSNDLGFGATLDLANFVADLSGTHQPIWIDLDTLTDVPDLINELVTQLRSYDPTLAPEILSYEVPPGQWHKAVRRIVTSLGRGRYVVAFSGVESVGRSPFVHHQTRRNADAHTISDSYDFLEKLVDRALERDMPRSGGRSARAFACRLRDSVLAFSLQPQESSPPPGGRPPPDWSGLMRGVRKGWSLRSGDFKPPLRTPILDRRFERLRVNMEGDPETWEILASLCAFRRWRSLVFVQALPLGVPSTNDDAIHERIAGAEGRVLAAFQKVLGTTREDEVRKVLIQLEGGYLWLSRPFRNRLWNLFDRPSEDIAGDGAGREALRVATLAKIQRAIARHYFHDLYQTSRDIGVFREHVYHRLETVRQLRRLFALATTEPALEEADRALVRRQLDLTDDEPLETQVADLWLKEYRAIVGVLAQEHEDLLAGAPGAGVRTWANALARELETLGPDGAPPLDLAERHGHLVSRFAYWREQGLDVIRGILIAVYRTALDTDMLLTQLHQRIDRRLLSSEAVESCWTVPELPGKRPSLRNWVTEAAFQEACIDGGDELGGANDERGERATAIIDDLLAAADGLRRSGDKQSAEILENTLDGLLETWRSKGGTEADPREERLRVARARWHRLAAENALTGIDPWHLEMSRGGVAFRGNGSDRKVADAAAARALDHAAKAIALLDYLPEADYSVRAYSRSLEGRAYTLRRRYSDAYRRFDLARAALSKRRRSRVPHEALVVTSLRHAECLILHACHDSRALDRLKAPQQGAIAAIHARLAEAADMLDRTETLLERGPRTPDWWACLFQLRTQLQIQRILTSILDVKPGGRLALEMSELGTKERHTLHSTRIGNATQAVRLGLDAIRRGLDVVSRRDGDRRQRFLRLWLELLLAAHHVRLQLWYERRRFVGVTERSVPDEGFARETWELWEQVNHQAGLERLPRANRAKEWFVGRRVPSEEHGLSTRALDEIRGVLDTPVVIASLVRKLRLAIG